MARVNMRGAVIIRKHINRRPSALGDKDSTHGDTFGLGCAELNWPSAKSRGESRKRKQEANFTYCLSMDVIVGRYVDAYRHYCPRERAGRPAPVVRDATCP
jgi:hypothetical protein